MGDTCTAVAQAGSIRSLLCDGPGFQFLINSKYQYIVSRNGRPEAPETDSKRMVKSTGGPGSSQLQESARYKTVYPNFPETKSRVSPLSKVWFSWGTRVLLWHKQAPLGVCNVMVRGISCEHHMAAGLPVHVQYTHPVAADAGCHPGKNKYTC